MSSKIRVLDDITINKIAAGEVIQNPSSVVKELVENAIDAGASEITVEINGGGRQLIRITDNGSGMNSDDALLCLERHATSKLKKIEELNAIDTMGFRGEAVPSIASISKFSILTNNSDDKTKATLVLVDGGKILKSTPAVRSRGTTFEVKNLFYNVPVRKKFQRSPTYDANEIEKVVSVMALANPDKHFQLIHNQKNILDTNLHKDLKERIKMTIGSESGHDLCRVDHEKANLHIEGYIGFPDQTRHNRTSQYLFINKRCVVSPLVSFAVRDGYGTSLATNRHPIFVLYLKLPGGLVDVNVHPQKKEVRLRQEQTIKELIFEAVDKALSNAGFSFDIGETNFDIPDVTYQIPESTQKFEDIPPTFSLPEIKIEKQPEPQETHQPQFFAETPTSYCPTIIATLPRFVLIKDEEKKGITIIDQKAAQSRILFETMINKKESLDVQNLLIPETFEVSKNEYEQIVDHLDILKQIGFDIQENGPNTFSVHGIPHFFNGNDIKTAILEITESTQAKDKEKEKKIAYAAINACCGNRRLKTLEANSLLTRLNQCQKSTHCPLGKPIAKTLTPDEIGALFK